MTALAVGSVGGKQRDESVCTVTRTLGVDQDVDGLTNGHVTAGTTAALLEKARTATENEDQNQTQSQDPAVVAAAAAARPNTLLVPTTSQLEAPTVPTTPAHELQEGELVPATRPEPQRFVTADEGISALAGKVEGVELSEKSGNVVGNGIATNGNGNGPHSTTTANKLDPNVS